MDTLTLDGEILHKLVLLGELLLVGHVGFLDGGHFGAHFGEDEELRVVGSGGEGVDTLVGEFYGVVFLVDDEEEGVGCYMHVLVVLLHIEVLCLLHLCFYAWLAKELDERPVLWETLVGAE